MITGGEVDRGPQGLTERFPHLGGELGTSVRNSILGNPRCASSVAQDQVASHSSSHTHTHPPLRDVAIRPEQDTTLRGQLVRLMTHVDTDVKHCAAELLFVLCKENVSRFVKYTGYGNAAGLLAARGLLNGRRNSGDSQYASQYSSDSDSDTEEYREAKARINLVTGRVEAEQPDPMEGMTEEEKEEEACRLIGMINRLSRDQIIQPMGVTAEGRLAPLWGQMRDCTLEEEEEDPEENLDLMPQGRKDKQME